MTIITKTVCPCMYYDFSVNVTKFLVSTFLSPEQKQSTQCIDNSV